MKTAQQIAHDVATGVSSAQAELQVSLDAIAARNEELNVFLYVDTERATAAAAAIDERIARGESVGPLAGVPVAIKDNLVQTDVPTTCSSKML